MFRGGPFNFWGGGWVGMGMIFFNSFMHQECFLFLSGRAYVFFLREACFFRFTEHAWILFWRCSCAWNFFGSTIVCLQDIFSKSLTPLNSQTVHPSVLIYPLPWRIQQTESYTLAFITVASRFSRHKPSQQRALRYFHSGQFKFCEEMFKKYWRSKLFSRIPLSTV